MALKLVIKGQRIKDSIQDTGRYRGKDKARRITGRNGRFQGESDGQARRPIEGPGLRILSWILGYFCRPALLVKWVKKGKEVGLGGLSRARSGSRAKPKRPRKYPTNVPDRRPFLGYPEGSTRAPQGEE